MPSRIETVKNEIVASISDRQKLTNGGFIEAFTLISDWFLAEDFEESFDSNGNPIPTVWICPQPGDRQTDARNGQITETLAIHLAVFCPVNSDSQIGTHVQLTEEILDTIHESAHGHGLRLMQARPISNNEGTPYHFVNMEQRAFYAAYDIRLQRPILYLPIK